MASGTKQEFVQICELLQKLYTLEGQGARFHQFMFSVNYSYYEYVDEEYTRVMADDGTYVQDMFYVENPRYIAYLKREIERAEREQNV